MDANRMLRTESTKGTLFFIFAILCRVLWRLKFGYLRRRRESFSDWLVRCGEALPGLFRVHIEQSATGSGPCVFLPLEHGAGVADVGDGGNVFHVTSCDCLKP